MTTHTITFPFKFNAHPAPVPVAPGDYPIHEESTFTGDTYRYLKLDRFRLPLSTAIKLEAQAVKDHARLVAERNMRPFA